MGIRRAYTKYSKMYYLKFYYKLNYIEQYWYNRKNQIKRNCKYTIKGLRDDIPKTLA